MIRRISTKLVLAVLGAVVVPYLGFALFVEQQVGGRLSQSVLSSLKGLAADLAAQIDRDVDEFRRDMRFLVADPRCSWAIGEYNEARSGRGQSTSMRENLSRTFDTSVAVKRHFELLMLIDATGHLVASNQRDQEGNPLNPKTLLSLERHDFQSLEWFTAGLAGRALQLDQHQSTLLTADGNPRWFIGFSAPVPSESQPEQIDGVLFGLVDWRHVQDEVRTPVLSEYFRGLVDEDTYPSAYAWVWKSDANTILAHPDTKLYGVRVTEDLGLAPMTQAALRADWGLFPSYEFGGRQKSAAFKHTKRPEDGGFDWVVGVGIDDDDIFRGVNALRNNLNRATALVLLIATLWTLVIARRITQPILSLREHTRRVAAGDLDARVEVRGNDELGELGLALNEMTREVKEKRADLVKAEKDAAWREMARQVAHDIKNPLTPIQLSVDLLRRAKKEQSPQYDSIFERTTDTIARQVEHLREIANDFHALTGSLKQRNPRDFDAGVLVDDLLTLNAAWAREASIHIVRKGGRGLVYVDEPLLRRVIQNLISNAIQAMPEGGELEVEVAERGARVHIDILDTGVGLSDEVRARLFEPYFTTRSTGTGLGLAIALRAVEEMGGKIKLEPRSQGLGTRASVELPGGRAGEPRPAAPAEARSPKIS